MYMMSSSPPEITAPFETYKVNIRSLEWWQRGIYPFHFFFLFADLFWFHSHTRGICTENYLVRFKNNVLGNIHNINSAHYKGVT